MASPQDTPVTTPQTALLVAALLFGGAACGSTAPQTPAPQHATLEIVNRTDVELRVAVRGRAEGAVAPGKRARVRFLTPGEATLEAEPVYDAPQGRTFAETRELPANGLERWELSLPGSDAPEPPKLADLRIENTLKAPIRVRVNQKRLGQVLPGDARIFHDLEAGEVQVSASSRLLAVGIRETLSLAPDAVTEWKVEAPRATLVVLNDTDEIVHVFLDQDRIGKIQPGEQGRWDELGSGTHELVVMAAHSGRRYERSVTLRRDFPVEWSLSAGLSSVRVVNRTKETLLVTAAGREQAAVVAGGELAIDELPTGPVSLRATGSESGTQHFGKVVLRQSQTYVWEVRDARGTVRVVNRTPAALQVYLDRSPRGRVEPGQTLLIEDAPRQSFDLKAASVDGTQIYRTRIEGGESGLPTATTWEVLPHTGALAVDNRRPERVAVFVDAKRVGAVDARSKLTFTGVTSGPRLVEAVGDKSKVVLRFPVAIPESGLGQVLLEDPQGTLVVVNKTGERLVLDAPLQGQQETLAADETQQFAVPIGTLNLKALGSESGLVYTKRQQMLPGRTARWDVEMDSGALGIENRTLEALRIFVDGREVGEVAKFETLRIEDVSPGLRRLKAVGAQSATTYRGRKLVQPDRLVVWSVQLEPARLTIDNQTEEPIHVTIGGSPYALVDAKSRKQFLNIAPGPKKVHVVGQRSRFPQEFTVALERNQTELVTVTPPQGSLMVKNDSGEAVDVLVDGRSVGQVAAGAQGAMVPVPAGRIKVGIEGSESRRLREYTLEIEPGVAVHLPVRAEVTRLTIANRTQRPLQIFVSDALVGTVAPGADLESGDLSPGRVHLRAEDEAGRVTHRETREVRAGDRGTWVLVEP